MAPTTADSKPDFGLKFRGTKALEPRANSATSDRVIDAPSASVLGIWKRYGETERRESRKNAKPAASA